MLLANIAQLKAPAAGRTRLVVIGSGAIGLFAANELIKRGLDVVVVESGGASLSGFPNESFRSIGALHEGIKQGRSRTLGGTTNLWGGQLVEFQRVDFEGRDWMPGSRWPVSYDEIAPFYGPTYESLGISADARLDANIWHGVLGSTPQFTEQLEIFLTRWLRIPGFAVLFSKQVETHPGLQVLCHHTAVGFRSESPNAGDDKIIAVRVKDERGIEHEIAGDTFILAAGTIEISRLLLHCAASTEWRCPWRNNGNLGAFFQDHLGGRIATIVPVNKRVFFDTFSTIVWRSDKFQPKLRVINEVLAREQHHNIQGMIAFESSVSENLVYLRQFLKAAIYGRQIKGVRDLFRNMFACARYLPPLMWRYIVDHRIFVPSGSKISLIMQGEHKPLRDSRITIDPSFRDANGLPRVVLDWRYSGEELASILAFAQRVDRALQAANLAKLQLPEALIALDPEFLKTLDDTNHQAGGAIMGFSPDDGVVDRNLKVFGTTNLYVGGAATFRTTSNANTTFTALAFATRLADHLASLDPVANTH